MAHILNRIFLSTTSPELSPHEARQSRTLQMFERFQARHACVREAQVGLAASSVLLINVSDQGTGFNVAEAIRSESQLAGRSGMAERVRLLGGHMEIISAPGEGTNIRARIPC